MNAAEIISMPRDTIDAAVRYALIVHCVREETPTLTDISRWSAVAPDDVLTSISRWNPALALMLRVRR